MSARKRSRGLTVIEVVGSLAIGAMLLAALGGVVMQSTRAVGMVNGASQLEQEAQFAVDRIIDAVRASRRLLVPMPDVAATAYSEAQRGVLAVTLDPTLDRDGNGFADADNDRDGRVDEDSSEDMTNDLESGIAGIDDDGDGLIDEDEARDDDEDDANNEDNVDGLDADGDGLVDEDVKHDSSDDGKPGLEDIDDDGDGSIDEGNNEDDDEDGLKNEDWLDARVFRVTGGMLVERLPDPNAPTGAIFTERPLAAGVTDFRVSYVAPTAVGLPPTLQITLTLAGAGGATATIDTRIRLGTVP
jgi:hypothetical protein